MDKPSMSMAALQPVSNIPRLIVVMGVSGSGKSTIAEHLAIAFNATFLDADDYHPKKNIEKMSRGDALSDEDRWPWLTIFGEAMAGKNSHCIGACSSLKRRYRKHLTQSAQENILYIYLDGSKALLIQRLSARKDHFMPTALLESQLHTLEVPEVDEYAMSVNIDGTPDDIVWRIKQQMEDLNYEK